VSRRVPLLLVGAFAGALILGTPLSAEADTHVEREPSQAELDAQSRQLETLRAQAEARSGDVQDARAATRAAAQIAGQALESYTTALRGLQNAQAEEERLDIALERANTAAETARSQVGRWARQAYQGGSGLNASPTLNALLGTNGAGRGKAGLSATLHTLRRIGENRSADLDAGHHAEVRAERAAADAAIATQAAATAAVKADQAKADADAAVAEQRRILQSAEDDLAATDTRIRAAEERQRRAAALLRRTNAGTGPVGSCSGSSDLSGYPNGQIPLTALCALATAPGHYLRADAAFAFDQLSAAYAVQFGTTICVTDSYRDYATQVRLYATKPNLAARPGRSNHGWGTATDLCGGIQTFGSAQHEWLFTNAPQFGWFHPSWAQPNGSRPEAWHWEFSG
jgi:hypothetical protein